MSRSKGNKGPRSPFAGGAVPKNKATAEVETEESPAKASEPPRETSETPAAVPDKPAEPKQEAPVAPATPPAKPAARHAYAVAEGRAVTTRMGRQLGAGREVTAEMFDGGQETLDLLVRKGAVVKG